MGAGAVLVSRLPLLPLLRPASRKPLASFETTPSSTCWIVPMMVVTSMVVTELNTGATQGGWTQMIPSLLASLTTLTRGGRERVLHPTLNTIKESRFSKAEWTTTGNERTLKQHVAQHGAVIVAVHFNLAFDHYKGGIFHGCPGNGLLNHAVTVVGYGTTEKGVDYWLIKNSHGERWGENGYMRMKRGVNMCGIGAVQVIVECERV